MLPSPTSSVLALRVWGGVGGGGTPTPNPSPRPPHAARGVGTPAGGGERIEFAACMLPYAIVLALRGGTAPRFLQSRWPDFDRDGRVGTEPLAIARGIIAAGPQILKHEIDF